MIEKVVAVVKALKLLVLGAVVLGLILVGVILLAPPQIAGTVNRMLTFVLASLFSWQLLLGAGALMILYVYLRDRFAMEAPDANGLYRFRRRYLDQHPEIVVGALESFHLAQLKRSEQTIPQGATHVTFSPRQLVDRTPTLPTTIDVPALPPPPTPFVTWFAALVDHPAHVLLLGDTGSGKSTLARAMLLARSRTDKIVVVDVHEKFNDWCGLPLYGVGRDVDDAARGIHLVHAEFLRRFKPGEAVGDAITVFIDEFPTLADERKEIVNVVVKWLRESRIVKIRVVVLATGSEVKTLGIEGQGSIRENFLQIRLRNFAIEQVPELASVAHPAIMIRGNSKQPPQILDTTDVPGAVMEQLPREVAWTPPEPLVLPDDEHSTPTTTTPQVEEPESPPQQDDPVLERRRRRIAELTALGWSPTRIATDPAVFGNDNGRSVRAVKQLQAELHAPADHGIT